MQNFQQQKLMAMVKNATAMVEKSNGHGKKINEKIKLGIFFDLWRRAQRTAAKNRKKCLMKT